MAAVRRAKPVVVVHQLTAIPPRQNVRRFDRVFTRTNRLRTAGTRALVAAAIAAGARRVVAQSFAGWRTLRKAGPSRGGWPMTKISRSIMVAAATWTLALLAFAQSPGYAQQASPPGQQAVPAWVQRGIPSAGHAALVPLVGSWRVQQSVYGTMGRSPDLPPIVSQDIRTTRVWVADGQYIEDTTEGTVEGQPYWRRGWLGYSNIDRRYEWVTIGPRVPMMIYLGKPGSGDQMPIEVTGVFTDQGVVSEQTVGKPIGQRTVIRIESHDRHVFELYFTPPGGKEQLALRSVYTRIQ